ncbi:MAG: porphobilinogen synthase [Alphaproteobacteria bacterium]|jgi:porphobilinogen synthase|nr:porphobilinogen synthase [Alphaproteobacteria bacterium]
MTPRQFPATRLRRLRRTPAIRSVVAETNLHQSDLIWPLFVIEGDNLKQPIGSMPGVFRYSIDQILRQCETAVLLGIQMIALFPKLESDKKDAVGSDALNPNTLICRCLKEVKAKFPNLMIICDVALDPYTTHGHDGIIDGEEILNDKTIESLVKQALLLAQAGCDILAPSDMMDGRIGKIRNALEENGYHDTIILSYAAKYASAFYGPFREAVGAGKLAGNSGKSTYQMDSRNYREAISEVSLDITEGADIVMVKPAMPYLDIIKEINNRFDIPCFAYQVSGEYSMLMAAIENGWLSEDAAITEAILGIKRAGACAILTYFAPLIAQKIQDGQI